MNKTIEIFSCLETSDLAELEVLGCKVERTGEYREFDDSGTVLVAILISLADKVAGKVVGEVVWNAFKKRFEKEPNDRFKRIIFSRKEIHFDKGEIIKTIEETITQEHEAK
ncbi:MAG: hypothetical protein HS117_17200 [Verrucomicrobiaceae bacterium]|nr:hypothetical protein [Verrucomicrobiaceae bacterium]